jgi:DNA-binding transcriptional LysR family regulator
MNGVLPVTAPDLLSLDLLASVAELGSFGRVARRHGLSQPAVSIRMRDLETRLGVALFERGPSGTRMSGEGRVITDAARRVLAEVAALEALVGGLRDHVSDRVRVAASLTVGEYLLPGWLRDLTSDSPHVALSLDVVNSSQVVSHVRERRADLGFVEGAWEGASGLNDRVVGRDRLVIVVSRKHPWASRRRALRAEELAAVDLVTREPGSGTREVLEAALAGVGGVHTHVELGSTGALLGAARTGRDPVVLSEIAVREDLVAGRLVEVATEGLDLTREFRAIWRRDENLGRLARQLLAVASRELGETP